MFYVFFDENKFVSLFGFKNVGQTVSEF